ncbi:MULTISPECIES: hypothetical protein [Streptomyces]|uniref:hypothetical protein n=1 Tax=Streptomyces lycopersici TaxID=2974589 RepID=UPI0021D113C2|nr:hypothetical protein [Streptomyces sp. NEAU-383]
MAIDLTKATDHHGDDAERDDAVEETAESVEAADEGAGQDKTKAQRAREAYAATSARARAALEAQRANVSARLHAWFTAEELTDGDLGTWVTNRKLRAQQQRGEELIREVTHLRTRLTEAKAREAGEEGDRKATNPQIERLKGQLAVAEVRLENFVPDAVMPPTPKEISHARWVRKAARAAAVVAGVAGWFKLGAMQPWVMPGTLLAAPFAWWALARPIEEDQDQSQDQNEAGTVAADSAEAPKVSLVKTPSTMAAAAGLEPTPAATEPGAADAAEAVGPRGPIASTDPLQIRGAADLITALVKAKVVEESERDETHVVGLIQAFGPGWTATVELPAGRTAADAIGRIAQLASALRVKAGQIELTADSTEDGHEGRFTIWVAHADNPFGTGKSPSELIAAEIWDFWADGIPIGLDARQSRRVLDMLWASLLIGGLKGYGKTYLARVIAAAAALDPYVRIILITGKSGPDWVALKKVAHAYVAGATPAKLNEIHGLLDETIADMQQRGEKLERLFETDPASCPEGKLTRELARKPGTELTLLVVDELQELLLAAAMTKVKVDEDEDGGGRGRSGKTVLVEKFARFVNVTRFVGGMGLFVTQRPDASSVPTELREVCDKRASARVKGAPSARMVLGDDAVNAGAAPHMLREIHRGVYVMDEGAESGHLTFKGDVIDLPDFGRICQRGQALRIKAGTLTGYAAEHAQAELAAARTAELLADAVAAFDQLGVTGPQGLTADTLAAALAEAHPDRYEGLDAAELRERLREVDITTGKVTVSVGDGYGKRVNGFTRAQLAARTGGRDTP